jgi:hypothetical protein
MKNLKNRYFMKGNLTFLIVLLAFSPLLSQNSNSIDWKSHQISKVSPRDGRAIETSNNKLAVPIKPRSAGIEQYLGETTYDLQSNGSAYPRIVERKNLSVAVIWTLSRDEGVASTAKAYLDRGTGYNGDENTVSPATTRLESRRTGFPAIAILGNEDEVIVAHDPEPLSPETSLFFSKKRAGQTTWTTTNLPTTVATLWPRMAASRQNIHIISVTQPVANQGVEYLGVDGHLLYHRSKDGGATWDRANYVIPGIDSTQYATMDLDSYSIDCKGDTVAIVLFGSFNDVLLAKSTNNGDTWTLKKINDFPLFKYRTDKGYPTSLVPNDPQRPTPNSIFTSDGSGSLVLDNNGIAHVVFSRMYVLDTILNDALTNFFPGTNGLLYWNENRATGDFVSLPGSVDFDNNGSINVTAGQIANYAAALSSHATLSIDRSGVLHCIYSGIMENLPLSNSGQAFRHLFHTKTSNGTTWTRPYDIINPTFFDVDLVDISESVFPSTSRRSNGNTLNVFFMSDFEPGLSVNGDIDGTAYNNMTLFKLPLSVLSDNGFSTAENWGLSTYPNPTSNQAVVTFHNPMDQQITVKLTDFSGRVVKTQEMGSYQVGNQQVGVDLSDLPSGLYNISLLGLNGFSTTKLVKF